MKDLGRTEKQLYDSPATPETQRKNKIIYPSISFPLSFIEGTNLKVGDNVDIHIRGRMSGMQDTKWSKSVDFEAKEGEVKKSGKKGKGESIIAEA
ncbi:hypothetical protein D4R71_00320 [bacterium]|nr:MAG: hypothetical protein D4R71_00320 [bacterium]